MLTYLHPCSTHARTHTHTRTHARTYIHIQIHLHTDLQAYIVITVCIQTKTNSHLNAYARECRRIASLATLMRGECMTRIIHFAGEVMGISAARDDAERRAKEAEEERGRLEEEVEVMRGREGRFDELEGRLEAAKRGLEMSMAERGEERSRVMELESMLREGDAQRRALEQRIADERANSARLESAAAFLMSPSHQKGRSGLERDLADARDEVMSLR
jgi:chromosome segregation ATPase